MDRGGRSTFLDFKMAKCTRLGALRSDASDDDSELQSLRKQIDGSVDTLDEQ